MSNTQRPSPGRSPEENITTVWWQAAWPKLKRKTGNAKGKIFDSRPFRKESEKKQAN
jgi:hypothetical protein